MGFEGACHCGRIGVRFETSKSAEAVSVRECQCGFCRRHGVKTTSDPEGRIEFRFAPDDVTRYRFGQGTADFLICRGCGVYIGTVMDIDGELYGIINAAGAAMGEIAARAGQPMDYGAETLASRTKRRKRIWSPAGVVAA